MVSPPQATARLFVCNNWTSSYLVTPPAAADGLCRQAP